MNNDLISREALKEAFADMREGYPIFSDTEMVSAKTIAEIIDNAPTVEYPEQITIKCDTEEVKQKLLSALRNARLIICEEAENEQERNDNATDRNSHSR